MKTFKRRRRIVRTVFASVTIVAFACLSGLAFAGGSPNGAGTYVPGLGITVPPDKAAALQHTPDNGSNRTAALSGSHASSASAAGAAVQTPAALPDPIPAKIVGPDVPVPISPAILRVTNGWVVSDGSTLVAVYAGVAGEDPTRGRLAIVRQDLDKGEQTVDIVDASDTGALTIVDPPLGATVETSAQQGLLAVRGAHGAKRALELSTDKVEVPAS